MAEEEPTDQEIAWRKAFLEFRDEDVERLRSLNELAEQYSEPVIEEFYQHLLSFEEGQAFFRDPAVLERVKRAQQEYFLGLTGGRYDRGYVENRLRIGAIHERIGLPFKLYLGMYNWYIRSIARRIFEAFKSAPDTALETFLSLTKLIFLDLGLAIDTYISQRERTIRAQQQAISELPTPVLQIRERLLIVPLIGVLDSRRALQLTEQLLGAIRTYRARAVVIDITGVPEVDSRVANHLLQTVDAARLMGASVVVTGLSPEVAQTLVRIGVDLTRLKTLGDLQGGVEEADRLVGYRVVRDEAAHDDPE